MVSPISSQQEGCEFEYMTGGMDGRKCTEWVLSWSLCGPLSDV